MIDERRADDARVSINGRRFWSGVRMTLAGAPNYTTGSIGRAIILPAISIVLEMSMQDDRNGGPPASARTGWSSCGRPPTPPLEASVETHLTTLLES